MKYEHILPFMCAVYCSTLILLATISVGDKMALQNWEAPGQCEEDEHNQIDIRSSEELPECLKITAD